MLKRAYVLSSERSDQDLQVSSTSPVSCQTRTASRPWESPSLKACRNYCAHLIGAFCPHRAAPAQKAKPQGPPAKPPQQQKPGSGTEDMKRALWEPPASPYCLIEEILYEDPWKLLVACMLLNKTSGRAVSLLLARLNSTRHFTTAIAKPLLHRNFGTYPGQVQACTEICTHT